MKIFKLTLIAMLVSSISMAQTVRSSGEKKSPCNPVWNQLADPQMTSAGANTDLTPGMPGTAEFNFSNAGGQVIPDSCIRINLSLPTNFELAPPYFSQDPPGIWKIDTLNTDFVSNIAFINTGDSIHPGDGSIITFTVVALQPNVTGRYSVNCQLSSPEAGSCAGDAPQGLNNFNDDELASNGTLPIIWESVSAKWADNKNSAVSWSTSQELNVSHYEVFRSVDGGSFKSVGKVAATGNSSGKSQYKLTDVNVKSIVSQTVTYRVQQYDIDGKSTSSKPVSLKVSDSREGNAYIIYPNPSKGDRIQFNTLKDVSAIDIFNSQGQKITSFTKINPAVTTYALSNFSNGTYRVVLRKTDGSFDTQNLVVAK